MLNLLLINQLYTVMNTLREVASDPSGMDSFDNYMGEIPGDQLLVVLTRSRDSDCLTESNWEVALEKLGGEGESVEIHRFGHWACGWWEALTVKAGSDKESVARDIYKSIKDYPVLDESHFSEKESEEAERVWSECYDTSDRIQYLRDNEGADFHGFADLLQCVRGAFAPYTNDGYSALLY